jgi:hypothetical protein
MKDSIFTPGPWDISWGTYQDGEGHEVCEYRKQGQPLACIAKVNYHDDQEGETKANARLIAAAPELLKALRWLRQCAKSYADADKKGRDWYRPDIDHAISEATKAIAKAEGRA